MKFCNILYNLIINTKIGSNQIKEVYIEYLMIQNLKINYNIKIQLNIVFMNK